MNSIITIMGPTASGKTDLALRIADVIDVQIISVDSALIYRHMDIGTAKPSPDVLALYPHRLVDIVEPSASYSVAQFLSDLKVAIDEARDNRKIPLLVGGTMMYFHALKYGLSDLPETDPEIRASLDISRLEYGIEYMHGLLTSCDPISAARLDKHDTQRIMRALEVYQSTGRSLSEWQLHNKRELCLNDNLIEFALMPDDRLLLHTVIMERFNAMLKQGFIEEVSSLIERYSLDDSYPSMRAVGYRQALQYLNGILDFDTFKDKAIVATRRLAKRQMTWLRSWDNVTLLPVGDKQNLERIISKMYI